MTHFSSTFHFCSLVLIWFFLEICHVCRLGVHLSVNCVCACACAVVFGAHQYVVWWCRQSMKQSYNCSVKTLPNFLWRRLEALVQFLHVSSPLYHLLVPPLVYRHALILTCWAIEAQQHQRKEKCYDYSHRCSCEVFLLYQNRRNRCRTKWQAAIFARATAVKRSVHALLTQKRTQTDQREELVFSHTSSHNRMRCFLGLVLCDRSFTDRQQHRHRSKRRAAISTLTAAAEGLVNTSGVSSHLLNCLLLQTKAQMHITDKWMPSQILYYQRPQCLSVQHCKPPLDHKRCA